MDAKAREAGQNLTARQSEACRAIAIWATSPQDFPRRDGFRGPARPALRVLKPAFGVPTRETAAARSPRGTREAEGEETSRSAFDTAPMRVRVGCVSA